MAADVSAKDGGEPGLKIYSHLSEHFASFAPRIMFATAGEAPYVLEVLMLGAGAIRLHNHYTDTARHRRSEARRLDGAPEARRVTDVFILSVKSLSGAQPCSDANFAYVRRRHGASLTRC